MVKIKLPIEKNEESKQILALCENHPWSLNQCQTQTLQGNNKTTFTFKGKDLHPSISHYHNNLTYKYSTSTICLIYLIT